MVMVVVTAIRGAELVMLMMVMIMMIVAMVMVIMIVVVMVFDRQEGRLDFENPVEIEGVAAEHGVEFDGAFGGRGAAWHRG